MGDVPVAGEQRGAAGVLGDDEGVGREDGRGARAPEELQRGGVLGVSFPRRIEKDEVERRGGLGEGIEQSCGAAGLDGVTGVDAESAEVGADCCDGGRGFLGEVDVVGAAAKRFNADSSGAGVKVREASAGDPWGEDVEESFAQPVAGGAGPRAAWRGELTRAIRACDNAHSSIIAAPFCAGFHDRYPASAYNSGMRGWSFLAGRFFGVEVRIHAFFLLLLAAGMAASALVGVHPMRMVALWGLLLLAVAIRETARAVAAAWFGLELRGILLLPTGGLMSFTSLEATERASQARIQRRMAVVGPLASIGFGLMLAGLILSSAPGVDLIGRPWITPTHLVRSLVWMNILLGLVNLLPALPLDGGHALQMGSASAKAGAEDSAGASPQVARLWGLGGGFSRWLAIGLIVSGILLSNMWFGLWLGLMGAFMLIGARMEGQGMLIQSDVETVRMRDVMLTQFSTLSASDTLEDALQRAVHSLQDVFPVVRGGTLVGSVSRQNIVEALAAEGNSYVQGVMTRSFQTAQPDDSLVKTLRRILGDQGAQLVPVMDGERIVGIVTPQNLSQSMGLLNQSRRMRRIES